ncbi:MAG: Cu(I)/Ag(I) efflux system membrane fusion protein [Crocinitomicaceae bacterium]|jgi:Cu(I)/Ag(I) efflux system membrane fusion protein
MNSKIGIAITTAVMGLIVGYLVGGFDSVKESTSEVSDEIWTCSMHPQIRKPEPGDCPICGMDLILLDGNSSDNPLVFEMTPDAVKIANIQTTVIGSKNGSSHNLTLSGKIKADETTASSLVSHIPGRIEKLYVSFTGQSVYKGQRIAKIYSPNLITAQRELLEALKFKDSNPNLLEASKNKLRYWKVSAKEIERMINEKTIKEHFDIYAEHSGVIHTKKVSVGDHLGQGEALFELQNLSKVWAVFDVYETELQSVHLGDEITFTTTSLSNETFTSKVTFIDPSINPMTRTAAVRLELNNSKKLLKPDMFISGELKARMAVDHQERLTVPKSAVLWTGERSVVYVKLPDLPMPSFEFREVTIGESLGTEYIVIDGLYSGDEVVTNGAFVIDASAQLNNRASMMNRNLLSGGSKGGNNLPDFSKSAPKEFLDQLKGVMNVYLSIKDDLVKSNSGKVKSNSAKMYSLVKNVDMKLVSGQSHMYWMANQEELLASLEKIKNSDKIEAQRKSFDELSNAMINIARVFGLYNYKVQYCSMANNNEGAYWLSRESIIRNPYFGDKMLSCGEVTDTIKKRTVSMPNKPTPAGHNH